MKRDSKPETPSSLFAPITRRRLLQALSLSGAALFIPGFGRLGANEANELVESLIAGSKDSPLAWCWSGGITDDSAQVVMGLRGEQKAELELRDETGKEVLARIAPASQQPDGVLRFAIGDLKPSTVYTYHLALGDEQFPAGRFTTFPAPGRAASFSVAFASCNRSSKNPVFSAIARQDPLFFMHMGDLHYRDIRSNDPNDFRKAYHDVVGDPYQAVLYRSRGIAYMWDDHDYGPNDSKHDNPSRQATHQVYRERVPHYPLLLPAESPERAAPIIQAFTVGRVRFVMTDLRSEHSREPRALMGRRQLEFFLRELHQSARSHRLIVWMSSVPWIDNRRNDAWHGGRDERVVIANFIKQHRIPVCVIAGDAHMVAIDDGSNSDYADGGGAPIPVFQAASLGAGPSYKGGPYSHGAHPGRQQFGLMQIEDSGRAIRVTWTARDGSDGKGDSIVQADRDGEGPIQYQFVVGA